MSNSELSNAAYQLAGECVAQRLPLSVQSWLDAMEWESLQEASRGRKPVPQPVLTETESGLVLSELEVLRLVMRPARDKGAELAVEVAKFLSVYAFGLRHDPAHQQAKLDTWLSDLEEWPLYAIRDALTYMRKHHKEEPSLAEVLKEVRFFCGRSVADRKLLLEGFVAGRYDRPEKPHLAPGQQA